MYLMNLQFFYIFFIFFHEQSPSKSDGLTIYAEKVTFILTNKSRIGKIVSLRDLMR